MATVKIGDFIGECEYVKIHDVDGTSELWKSKYVGEVGPGIYEYRIEPPEMDLTTSCTVSSANDMVDLVDIGNTDGMLGWEQLRDIADSRSTCPVCGESYGWSELHYCKCLNPYMATPGGNFGPDDSLGERKERNQKEEESMDEFVQKLVARKGLSEEQVDKLQEIRKSCGWEDRFMMLMLVERIAQERLSYEMLGYKRDDE